MLLAPPDLLSLVTRLATEPGRWRADVPYSPGSRSWARLPAPDGVDLWLLRWLPGTSTELHDHGSSAAAFTVLEGELEEVRPSPYGLRTVRLRTGACRRMAPGEIHDVRGSLGGPALSLHAYGPRLTSMTWYDDDLRPVRTGAPEQ